MASKLASCKHCGKDVAKGAKECPSCGGKLKMGWGKKALIFFGVWIVLAVVVSATKDGEGKKSGSSVATVTQANAATPEEKKPVITVSASQMAKDYESNEIAADEKYKGKMVQITGVVDGVEKDLMDNPFLSLDSGWSGYYLHCYFEDTKPLVKLKKGQKVTVVGEVKQLSLVFIELKECELK